ncbi:hypothetical protein TI04_00755 [Achromatium sp. WMS2]|nr:hypothetical protein TI04_00755 [Achromatium sp. WMS2]
MHFIKKDKNSNCLLRHFAAFLDRKARLGARASRRLLQKRYAMRTLPSSIDGEGLYVTSSRHSGMDCRNPEARDGVSMSFLAYWALLHFLIGKRVWERGRRAGYYRKGTQCVLPGYRAPLMARGYTSPHPVIPAWIAGIQKPGMGLV